MRDESTNPDSLTNAGADPRKLDELARRSGVASIDFHASIDSTQDAARALADEGADAWRVVVADRQTAGRGQHGRSWRDSPAHSLLLSIILRPADPAAMALLPIRVALAIAGALDAITAPDRIGIKWPNDLLLSDRKLGGILVEGQTRGSDLVAVVGIGLNILSAPSLPEDPAALPPIALADSAPDVSRLDVLATILRAVRHYPYLLRPMLEPKEVAAYASHDWLLGRRITEPLAGVARGIDMSGRLVLLDDSGVLTSLVTGRVR